MKPGGATSLTPHCRGAAWQRVCAAMNSKILPAVDQFKPELILASAGFDAHKNDPLGALRLDEDDFAWITRELLNWPKTLRREIGFRTGRRVQPGSTGGKRGGACARVDGGVLITEIKALSSNSPQSTYPDRRPEPRKFTVSTWVRRSLMRDWSST